MAVDRDAALIQLRLLFTFTDAQNALTSSEFEERLVRAVMVHLVDGDIQADEALHRVAGSVAQVADGAQEVWERIRATQ